MTKFALAVLTRRGARRRRVRQFDGGVQSHSRAAARRRQCSRQCPFQPAKPGDILSVLTVEHQVDITAQRDGVVTSLTRDEGSAVKANEVLGSARRPLPANGTHQSPRRSAGRGQQPQVQGSRTQSQDRSSSPPAAASRAGPFQRCRPGSRGIRSQRPPNTTCTDTKPWSKAATQKSIAWISKLDQTRIHAPFAGVVVRRYIREGQAISKGDKCFRVSQLAPLQVQFQVPESSGRRPAARRRRRTVARGQFQSRAHRPDRKSQSHG